MPGPPKSLLKTLSITKAGRASACHHDKKNHKFSKGDVLLEVKVGRDASRLCVACAIQSVESGLAKLTELRAELKGVK